MCIATDIAVLIILFYQKLQAHITNNAGHFNDLRKIKLCVYAQHITICHLYKLMYQKVNLFLHEHSKV